MKHLLKIGASILTVTLLLVFYVGLVRGRPGNPTPQDIGGRLNSGGLPFESSHERGPYSTTLSLVQDYSFALSPTLAEASMPDVGRFGDKYYILFAPGLSVLAVPFYILGSRFNLAQVTTFYMSSIFAVGGLICLYHLARGAMKLSPPASLFACLVFGFATIALSYANTIYQHHLSTFLLLSAYLAAWTYKQHTAHSWLGAVWVWFAYGVAFFVDYPNLFLFLPAVCYLLLSATSFSQTPEKYSLSIRLSVIVSAVVFVLLGGGHAVYNYSQFGSPFTLHGSLPTYQTTTSANSSNPAPPKSPAKFFSEELYPRSAVTLLFSSDRGLFFFSPILALGVLGLLVACRRLNLETACFLAQMLVVLFLYSSWGDPWGGWAFGPRYLIPAMPFLSLFAAWWVFTPSHRFIKKLVAVPLLLYSSAIAIAGSLTTNVIATKAEGLALNLPYNFLLNWEFLQANRSASFVYDQFLRGRLTLITYALVLYAIVITCALIILFILPRFAHED